MHKGLDVCYIHHDMKPLNVLLEEPYKDNGDNRIKICDFGGTRTGRTLHAAFTPQYAAPEIMFANPYDFRVDIYAFGVTLWEIFTRKIPFAGVDKTEIPTKIQFGERPDLGLLEDITPKKIKELIEKCWKGRKEERPSDDEIINALKALL